MLFQLSKKGPVILYIDEFEKAGDLKRFSPDFWGMLRSYAQESGFTLVMATRQPLKDIEQEINSHPTTSPLHNIFQTEIKLGPFSEEESRGLINRSLEGTGISFTEEEIDKIITQSGNHPARLQALCYDLYNIKAELPPATEEYGTTSTFTADTPSDVDQIWGGVYIQALADFIRHEETTPPLVIGINAPWGAGKTSLMEALRKEIDNEVQKSATEDEERSFPTAWFNAWKYAKDYQLWAALVHSVIKQLIARRKPVDRIKFLLKLNWKRIDKEKIYNSLFRRLPLLFGCVIIVVFTLLFVIWKELELIWGLLSGKFDGWGVIGGLLLLIDFAAVGVVATKVWKLFSKPLSFKYEDYLNKPDYEKKIGFLREVEEDFARVLALLTEEQKFVIFVDDLDRCSPGKIVEVIEAINVFFGSEKCQCIFVLGIDTDFIAKSIECAYKPLVQAMEDGNFGKHFLQKIIQVSLTLPEPTPEQLKSYFKSIINSQQDGEIAGESHQETDDVEKPAGDEIIQRERDESLAAEQSASEQEEAERDEAVKMLSENDPQVREVLEEALEYLEKKPRQVIRFLNLFRLSALLHIRQQGPLSREDFQRLAKRVAISMRYPEFIQQVGQAGNARPTGGSDAITQLEEMAADDAKWAKLKGVPEWKDKIDDALRDILKKGVSLSGEEIDFATLI